jgi:hypothetical protein
MHFSKKRVTYTTMSKENREKIKIHFARVVEAYRKLKPEEKQKIESAVNPYFNKLKTAFDREFSKALGLSEDKPKNDDDVIIGR